MRGKGAYHWTFVALFPYPTFQLFFFASFFHFDACEWSQKSKWSHRKINARISKEKSKVETPLKQATFLSLNQQYASYSSEEKRNLQIDSSRSSYFLPSLRIFFSIQKPLGEEGEVRPAENVAVSSREKDGRHAKFLHDGSVYLPSRKFTKRFSATVKSTVPYLKELAYKFGYNMGWGKSCIRRNKVSWQSE